MDTDNHAFGISASEASLQVDRIIRSRVFSKAARSQRFLRYLVAAAFAEPPQVAKEYTIAIEVFDRNSSYDPVIDSTVRVEAGRLRNRLREYYDEEGKADLLLIQLPKGRYSIVLSRRAPSRSNRFVDEVPFADPSIAAGRPSALRFSPLQEGPALQSQTDLLLFPGSANAEATPYLKGAGTRELQQVPSPEAATPAVNNTISGVVWKWAAFVLGSCCLLLVGYGALRLFGHRHRQPVIHSMAVLPLKNFSGDPGQDYFADGTTDELITELARVPNLRVLSWSSVVQERGTRKPLRAIAKELQADVIVEGSVARSGDRVRINAQMIDARNENHLWASSLEGKAGDILMLEDEAAQEIAAHASLAVDPARLSGNGRLTMPINPAAHDAYLRGRNYFDKRQGPESVESFQQAIALAPNYASAYAGLAVALESKALLEEGNVQENISGAMAAANKALQLEPENGEAMIARGSIEANFLWNWNAAKRDLSLGVMYSPSNSFGRMMLAVYDDALGEPEKAVDDMRQAVEIDPLSFWMARHYGSTLFFARRYDDALKQFLYAREMHPASWPAVDRFISETYEKKGKYDEAVRYDLPKKEDGKLAEADADRLTAAYRRGGWKEYWTLRLKQYRRPKIPQPCDSYFIGLAALRAGRQEEAFEFMKRAAEQHCFWMITLRVNPEFDDLRSDSRFSELVNQLGLPGAAKL